jgi:hypothetical protein
VTVLLIALCCFVYLGITVISLCFSLYFGVYNVLIPCRLPLGTDAEGKQLVWNVQVNASAVTVKLIWIKAAKHIATSGEIIIQAPKVKPRSLSTRNRNAQRLTQRKAGVWDSSSLRYFVGVTGLPLI